MQARWFLRYIPLLKFSAISYVKYQNELSFWVLIYVWYFYFKARIMFVVSQTIFVKQCKINSFVVDMILSLCAPLQSLYVYRPLRFHFIHFQSSMVIPLLGLLISVIYYSKINLCFNVFFFWRCTSVYQTVFWKISRESGQG